MNDTFGPDDPIGGTPPPYTEPEPWIDRKDTLIRLGLTLLFGVISGVLRTLGAALVAFSILWSLITQQPPPARVRAMGNRLATYAYRITRWMTYNEAEIPFPFSDLAESIEPGTWSPYCRESEDLGTDRWAEPGFPETAKGPQGGPV